MPKSNATASTTVDSTTAETTAASLFTAKPPAETTTASLFTALPSADFTAKPSTEITAASFTAKPPAETTAASLFTAKPSADFTAKPPAETRTRRWFQEPLSDHQQLEVDNALSRSQHDADFVVCANFGNIITSSIVKRLRLITKEEQNNPCFDNKLLFLNDELINFNMSILKECDEALCTINPGRRKSFMFLSGLIEMLSNNKSVLQ